MATAGSLDIPEGDLIFDQHNVRTTRGGPHRTTVCSGSLRFVSTPIGYIITWQPQDEATEKFRGEKSSSEGEKVPPRRASSFWFELRDLKSYICFHNKDHHELTFMLCDGTRHPTLVFDSGKQRAFVDFLESKIHTRVSPKDKKLHLVVGDDHNALQKSFSTLDLFQYEDQTLVSRLVRDPLPTFADGLAKVTNFFTQGPQQKRRQISEGMLDLNPANCGEFEDFFTINVDQEPGYDYVEQVAELPVAMPLTRSPPLAMDEWLSYFDGDGRIVDPNNLRARIFRGGCSPEIRREAWKFLLGVYDFNKTAQERAQDHARLTEDYYRMKLQWKSFSADQERRFTAFAAKKSLVEKDVHRTDRSLGMFAGDSNEHLSMPNDILVTYIMYDFDLGYVQGMSDLLSPILSVMQNEPDSFWCFAKFVAKIRCNFVDHDRNEEKEQRQLGIKLQLQQLHQLMSVAMPSFGQYLDDHESGNLYFCFRWLLIWFKREFAFEDVKRLWEVLWTGLPCRNFHLLFCVAILDEEKIRIMENNFGLTEILKHINDMCYKISLEENLIRAEQLYFQMLAVPKVAAILGLESLAEKIL